MCYLNTIMIYSAVCPDTVQSNILLDIMHAVGNNGVPVKFSKCNGDPTKMCLI